MSAFRNQLMQRLQSTRFYVSVTVVLLVAFWVQSRFDSWWYSLPAKICVINGQTPYIGSAVPAMVDDETNREAAKLVAAAALDRIPVAVAPNSVNAAAQNPISTLKWPETLARVTNTEVRNRVEKDCERDNNQFIAQKATQTFNLTQVIIQQRINDATVKMLLQGDVVIVTKVHGETQATSKSARVTMLLTRNDDWTTNHKWPKVCTYLTVEYPQ